MNECPLDDSDANAPFVASPRTIRELREALFNVLVVGPTGRALDFLAGENGSTAPGGVLVDFRRQLSALDGAWVGRNQLIGDGILEHPVQNAVNVSDCPGRKLIPPLPHFLFQAADQRAHVTWPYFRKNELAQLRKRVTLETSFVIVGAPDLTLSSVSQRWGQSC